MPHKTRKSAKSAIRLIVLLSFGAWTALFGAESAITAKGAADVGVFAEVDGSRVSLAEGDVIAKGDYVGDGVCSMPSFDLVGKMDGNHPAFDIEIEVAADCSLVVREARLENKQPGGITGTLRRAFAPITAQAATTEYRIFGEYSLHDFVHLCLTCSLVWVEYFDNGSQVWGGHNPSTICSNFTLTGWYVLNCGHTGNNLSGPSEIWHETLGSFNNIFKPGLYHQLWARPVGNPGGGAWVLCQRTGAGAPVSTHWHCSGSITPR